jgi:hypothetical protein
MLPAEVKVYCYGNCGRSVTLKFPVAMMLIDTDGQYKDNTPVFVCHSCHAWFDKVTTGLLLKEESC